MQIKRIFNNNAVMFLNKKGREEIALGKGVGYQKRLAMILMNLLLQNYLC